MPINGIKTILSSASALFLGMIVSIVSLITPIREEVPQLLKKPEPSPLLTEEARELTKEEQATMSASFIREFEGMISSNAGERR